MAAFTQNQRRAPPSEAATHLRRLTGSAKTDGPEFEYKLAGLLALRARREDLRFQVFTNVAAATPCDDVVLRVLHPRPATIFVQLKHGKENKHVDTQALTSDSGDFSLKKYFKFYADFAKKHAKRDSLKDKDERLLCACALEDVRFILFTNRTVRRAEEAWDEDDQGLPFPHEGLFRTGTARREEVFSFGRHDTQVWDLYQNQSEEDQYQDFLSRLRVFSGQASARDLEALIREELNRLFGSPLPQDELFLSQYLGHLKTWSHQEGRGFALTETSGEVEKILVGALQRRAKAAAGGGALAFQRAHCGALRSALRSSGALWVAVRGVPAGHRAAKLLQVFDEDSASTGLWVYVDEKALREYPLPALEASCGVCDVVVVDGVEVVHLARDSVVNIGTKRKLVVLGPTEERNVLRGVVSSMTQLEEHWSLCELTQEAQEKLMASSISLQGKKMLLGDLQPLWIELRPEVDGALLSALVKGDAALGAAPPSIEDELTLSRTLQHASVLYPAVLHKMDPKTDHLALSGFSRKEVDELRKKIDANKQKRDTEQETFATIPMEITIQRWTVLAHADEDISKDHLESAFKGACAANASRNVHWIHNAGRTLTWRRTRGSAHAVAAFVRPLSGACTRTQPTCEHAENAAADAAEWRERVGLLLGAPGMGKTHFLQRVAEAARAQSPPRWTVVVELIAHRELLKSLPEPKGMTAESVVELLAEAAGVASRSAAESCLRAALLRSGAVDVFVDGVDEVAPAFKEKVLRLLELLLETKAAHVWVASRPEFGESLERVLGCVSLTLLPFSREKQVEYVTAKWASAASMESCNVQHLATETVDAFAGIGNTITLRDLYNTLMSILPSKIQYLFSEMVSPLACITDMDGTIPLTVLDVIEYLPNTITDEIYDLIYPESTHHKRLTFEKRKEQLEKYKSFLRTLLILMAEKDVTLNPEIMSLLSSAEQFLNIISGSLSKEETRTSLEMLNTNYREIVSKIVEEFRNETAKKSLLATPLHSFMVGETFAEDARKALNRGSNLLNRTVSLLDIFSRFVDLKRDHWRTKHGLSDSNIENTYLREGEDTIFRELHQNYAMLLWSDISKSRKRAFLKKAEKRKAYLKQSKEKNGLLWLENGKPVFAHFVLKEYFVASWLLDNRNKQQFVRLAIRSGTGSTVRYFLDAMLSEGLPLHQAVLENNMDAMMKALISDAQVKTIDLGGRSALHLAAAHGRLEAMNRLLAAGCCASLRDTLLRWTPLQYADEALELEAAERLLNEGGGLSEHGNIVTTAATTPFLTFKAASLDLEKIIFRLLHSKARDTVLKGFTNSATGRSETPQDGREANCKSPSHLHPQTNVPLLPPLHVASQNNCMKVAKVLLKHGFDVNLLNEDQRTSLHIAAKRGHADMTKLLLSHGAKLNTQDGDRNTALHLAIHGCHSEVVNILLCAEADCNISGKEGQKPLHAAALLGSAKDLELLLKAGADVDSRDSNQLTPMHMAVVFGHMQIVEKLLDASADINAYEAFQMTPLHAAAEVGHAQIVQKLVKTGADVNARNARQETPLHIAAEFGQAQAVENLVGAGANLNASDAKHMTPLHIAARSGHAETVEKLVGAGADINAHASYHLTPLHIAAIQGHLKVVQILLSAGAAIDIRCSLGMTPLHYATLKGHVSVVQALVASGARCDIPNHNGSTPLQVALQLGTQEVYWVLWAARLAPLFQNLLQRASRRSHSR